MVVIAVQTQKVSYAELNQLVRLESTPFLLGSSFFCLLHNAHIIMTLF